MENSLKKNILKLVAGGAVILGGAQEMGRQQNVSLKPDKAVVTEESKISVKEITELFKQYRVSTFEEMEKLAITDKVEHSFFEVRAGNEIVLFYTGKGSKSFASKFEVVKIASQLPQGVTEITVWHTHPTKPDKDFQVYDKNVDKLITKGLAVPPPIPPSYFDTQVGLEDEINFRKLRPEISLKQGVQDCDGRWIVDIDSDSDLLKEDLYQQFTNTKKSFQDSVTSQEQAMLKHIEDNEISGNSAELTRIRSSEIYKEYIEKINKIKNSNYEFFSHYIYEINFDDRYSILNAWGKDNYQLKEHTNEAIEKLIKKYKEKFKVSISYETSK